MKQIDFTVIASKTIDDKTILTTYRADNVVLHVKSVFNGNRPYYEILYHVIQNKIMKQQD